MFQGFDEVEEYGMAHIKFTKYNATILTVAYDIFGITYPTEDTDGLSRGYLIIN